MISYPNALQSLLERALHCAPKEAEVPLIESVGKVLNRDVSAIENIPPFDNSAMDGFALRSSATLEASPENASIFNVKAFVAAGDEPIEIHAGEPRDSVEIMTGGMMPSGGFDAVVKLEEVERIENGGTQILLRRPIRRFENIRAKGSDFQAGSLIARSGTVISPEQVMALASVGISKVFVRRPLRIALISTGKELLLGGQERENPAQIWNSSGPYLIARLRSLGCEVLDFGISKDNAGQFEKFLNSGVQERVDIFLSTGAVSMGRHDFVMDSLKKLGAKIHFHKAAIRPGKPICFAELLGGHSAFFGLPGNPVSTAVGQRFFVEPFIRARLGLPAEMGTPAILAKEILKPEGFRCFYKGNAQLNSAGLRVKALSEQGSYLVSGLLHSNCWIELPEGRASFEAGQEVFIYPFESRLGRGVLL